MARMPGGPGVLRRGWLRLVDGAFPWGSFIVCLDRMGVTRYRLVIYPPGINEAERRRLRVWRGWPMWGALLWIASYSILTGLIEPALYLFLARSRRSRSLPVLRWSNAVSRATVRGISKQGEPTRPVSSLTGPSTGTMVLVPRRTLPPTRPCEG